MKAGFSAALANWLGTLANDVEPWASFARYAPQLLEGVALTLNLIVLSSAIGLVLAIGIALARISRSPLLWLPAYGYIYFFRGTPVLVQLYLIYYGLAQFEALRDFGWLWESVLSKPYWCAIIAFSLNAAAYTAELMRGAIHNMPRGEIEAAQALGLPRSLLYQRIIFPRVFRMILPAYSNDFVLLIKSSALASTITLLDITGMTQKVIARTYMSMDFFVLAGVLYLLITAIFIALFRFTEYSLNHHRRATAKR